MRSLNIILLLAAVAISAQAWWDKGHMLVSQIAWNHLTDTKRTSARDRLNQLVVALNPFTDGRSQTFTEAAVWADDIKSYGASIFDRYHFTNIAYDPDFTFYGMTQIQQDINAINIINWCTTVLKRNINGTSFERAWMARYLLHVIGDIHQPLHSTNMYNATLGKDGDLGGNKINISLINGTTMILHSYFDAIALEQDPDNPIKRPLSDADKKSIEDNARTLMNAYPATSLSDLIAITDPKIWGVQAYKIAVDKIYSYVKKSTKITEQYQTEMRKLLQKQIALGGYRLAESIASIFA